MLQKVSKVQKSDDVFTLVGSLGEKKIQLEMGHTTPREVEAGHQGFKICLSYIVSSKPAWTA